MNKQGFAPIIVVLIVVVVAAAGVGILQYAKNRSASISGGDNVLPVSAGDNILGTEGWETYRNEQYGFEFQYPKEYGLLDESQRWDKRANAAVFLNVDTYDVEEDIAADGPCGLLYPDLLQEQQQMFEMTKNGDSFNNGFEKTYYGINYSTAFTNQYGTKIAQGFQFCYGIAEEHDPANFTYLAMTFHKGKRVSFRIALNDLQSGPVTVGDIETKAQGIINGEYPYAAQQVYNEFKIILSTFKFTK